MSKINIIEFEEKYLDDFKRLSYEWLEKYVSVEPEDLKILNNPQEVILDKGGFVFFIKYGENIAGTVSLIKVNNTTFELAKLAVTEKYQGLGLGNELVEHCLHVALLKNAKKIILYTNHKLKSAIALYNKFNFKEIPLLNNKYLEADLIMELDL